MPKRLVVCCDGTWNRPDQVAPTNVLKLAMGVAPQDGRRMRQLVFYQPGVGTRRFDRWRGGAFGVGLSRNVKACYRFLIDHYELGDELFFFGFSRGAFTARSTVGLVRNSGILRPENRYRIDDAYRLYRSRNDKHHPRAREAELFRRTYSHPDPIVHFVGVWDTVGALGIPVDGLRLPLVTRFWSFHDTTLSSYVRHAYQALAIDERRGPFRPTLWTQEKPVPGQTLEQVWFAGVHSDVGGGYPEPELSEIPLLWMAERAREAGLAFNEDHFQPPRGALDRERRCRGQDVAPNALGKIHDSLGLMYRLLPRCERKLKAAGCAVASSAVRRRRELSDYHPPALDEYFAADCAEVRVPGDDRP